MTALAPAPAADRPDRPDRSARSGRPGWPGWPGWSVRGRGEPDELVRRLRARLSVAACCLGLAVLAVATRPGKIIADTKVDLVVDPLGFLGRSLHLWDAAQLGQLQNQAVGYLFPMGPFFAAGHLAGLPPWITQRLWLALLLCLAFLGVRRVAARLGAGGPRAWLAAGLVYALAPNGLATMGQISSEYLPYAMLPWILLPLMTAAEGGSRVRAAARSGLAVACCGGINGAATVAVLAVPALYLLTRPRGGRLRIAGWWALAVAVATSWWLIPLLFTARYGFSWLTYTEKASATTGTTGVVNVLRGTERWVNFVVVDGQTWWPVGHALSSAALPVVCTALVAALGLAGLLRPRVPERAFLAATLLAGVAIMSAGHLSAVEGPLAAPFRDLLDGPLAPFRNLHKFDGLVRLPLALGVAWLAASIPRGALRVRTVLAAGVALGGLAATALSGGLSGPGDFREVPGYWRDAAGWLNARAGRQAVLAVPGAAFGQYAWGRPMDEMTQPLLTARWGVRQLVPAGSPGYTRALDAIDQRVASGQGSAGLAEFLGRMGIRYLLVRNDLQRSALRGDWPVRLHQALDSSPGLVKAARFGDFYVGQPFGDAVSTVDQRYPPLEVYEVTGARSAVNLVGAEQPIRLYGSPEGMLPLADGGVLKGRPVLLDGDAADLGGTPVASDALRRVRRNFGELRQTSPVLSGGAGLDVVDEGWDRYATVARYRGITSVTASSSPADAGSVPQQYDPGKLPYAAVDGDPRTSWETGTWAGPVGQWLRVDLERPADLSAGVAATFAPDRVPAQVVVRTDTGSLRQDVHGRTQRLAVPAGATRSLRIEIARLDGSVRLPDFAKAGIAELALPGVGPDRTYRLPAVPGSVALSRGPGTAAECAPGSASWVCSADLLRRDEEGYGLDRTFRAAGAGRAALTGTAVLTDPDLIERYTGSRVKVTAASAYDHPAAGARAAFDGDRKTTWIAADGRSASYTVSWGRRIRLDRIAVDRPPAARGPLRLRIQGDGGEVREGLLGKRGKLSFAPLTAGSLVLTFTSMTQVAPQITDIALPGVPHLPDVRNAALSLPCGQGPELELDGTRVATSASGALGDLLAARPLRFAACGAVPLAAGDNRLRSVRSDPYRIETAVVDSGGLASAAAAPVAGVAVRKWTAASRVVEVRADRRSFLEVTENFNRGWQARAGGTVLRPVRLDGWKQAWVVPAGTYGTVELSYRPDRMHRPAVFGGLALLPGLLLVGVRRSRTEPAHMGVRAGRGWRVPVLAVAIGLGFWLAGFVGVLVVGAAAYASMRVPGVRARAAGVLLLAGAVSWAVGLRYGLTANPLAPTGLLGDVLPQLLGLAVVGVVSGAAGQDAPPGDS